MYTFKQRIANSVKLLDEKVPNWRSKISIEKFNIGQNSSCILGQIFGSYYIGIKKLNVDTFHSFYGFNGTFGFEREELQKEWLLVLNNKTGE